MFKLIPLVALLSSSVAVDARASASVRQDFVNAQAAENAMRERRLAALTAAGIDMNSTEALVKALSTKEVPVQLAAVYLLKERKALSAIPELRRLVNDAATAPLLKVDACDALADLDTGSSNWKRPCAGLLAQQNDAMVRIRAAGVFARHGDATGWDLVRGSLISSEQVNVEEASMVAPLFDGLTQVTGGRRTVIDVLTVCVNAFPRASAALQLNLIGVIARTANASDAGAVSGLMAEAKSPYAKSSLESIVKTLRAK